MFQWLAVRQSRSSKPDVRLKALQGLADVRSPNQKVLGALIRLLGDLDQTVREDAVERLNARGDVRLACLNSLRRPARTVADNLEIAGAICAMAALRSTDAVDSIGTHLDAEGEGLRGVAVLALAHIGDDASLAHLLDALRRSTPQETSIESPGLGDLTALSASFAAALACFGAKAAGAVPALTRLLESRHFSNRVWAIRALGATGAPTAALPLIATLLAKDLGGAALTMLEKARQVPTPTIEELRGEAAFALRLINTPNAQSALLSPQAKDVRFGRKVLGVVLSGRGLAYVVLPHLFRPPDGDGWEERRKKQEQEAPGVTEVALAVAPTEESAQSISSTPGVTGLVSSAVAIIEKNVRVAPGFVTIDGAGAGPIMEAVQLLGEAHKAQPDNREIHYGYASALHIASQGQQAEEEMRLLRRTDPFFAHAKLAIEGWARWQSPFALPTWGPGIASVPPAIAGTVKTCILLAVRDGLLPRAALFLRDQGGDFEDTTALKTANIDLATVIGRTSQLQVGGIYGKIWDNPTNPYGIEAASVPVYPRGHASRAPWEYLCLQEDLDFAILSSDNRILLNRRLPMSPSMRDTNHKLGQLLEATDGQELEDARVFAAVLEHQRSFSPADVRY